MRFTAKDRIVEALGRFSRHIGLQAGIRPDPVVSVLVVCAFALTVWLLVGLTLPPITPARAPLPTQDEDQEQQTAGDEAVGIRTYLADIAGRPLFRVKETEPTAVRDAGSRRVAPLQSAADDLELVGVVGGDTPQAIVRNRKSGDTYYVSVGQAVGPMTVKQIDDRSVVLQSGDEEIELRL